MALICSVFTLDGAYLNTLSGLCNDQTAYLLEEALKTWSVLIYDLPHIEEDLKTCWPPVQL